jgi:hypothetical protein
MDVRCWLGLLYVWIVGIHAMMPTVLADKLWLRSQLRIQVEEAELERRQRTIADSGLVHIPVILLPRHGR